MLFCSIGSCSITLLPDPKMFCLLAMISISPLEQWKPFGKTCRQQLVFIISLVLCNAKSCSGSSSVRGKEESFEVEGFLHLISSELLREMMSLNGQSTYS